MSDWLNNYLISTGYTKYAEARDLNEVQNLQDPKSEPFKSKYKARELLEEIESDLKKSRDQFSGDEEIPVPDLMVMLQAFLHYHIGVNFIYTEERPSGEKHLKECLKIIGEKFEICPELVSIAISAHNEISILWASREEDSKSCKENLDFAKSIYHKFRHEVGNAPFGIHDLLTEPDKRLTEVHREARFEKLYTMTLFYLAQACRNTGETDLSAQYCIKTLQRQLKAQEYDPKEWCLNAAGISQYYIQQNNMAQAKHCLCCASVISEEIKQPEIPENNDEDLSEEIARLKEVVPQARADISRCWVKYCIALLEMSKESLQNDIGEMDLNKQRILKQLLLEQDIDESKNIEKMPLEVTSVEEKVPHLIASTFEQARDIFVIGKRHCDTAMSFFVLDGFVTDNVEVKQDLSTLYKLVSFFEPEMEKRCRMHKRRIDLLSATLEELNQQFYLVICQQLQFELAETYSDMLDLKVAIANNSEGRPTQHAFKKMNSLCSSGILYFSRFLNTLKNPSGDFPGRFEDNVERAGVIAHFYLARLYSKILTTDESQKQINKQKSLDNYKWVVDYVQKNPDSRTVVEKEYEICKEMSVLLPASLSRTNNEV